MTSLLAIVFGAFFVACLSVLVVFVYKDKPWKYTPCRDCAFDCPSKKLSPSEQKEYYEKEQMTGCRGTGEKTNEDRL